MVLLDPQLTDALPLMFDYLGVPDTERPVLPMEAEARQRQLADLLRRLARARSQRGEPLVLLIEDLHWLDAASEQFLESIVEAVSGAPTLLLVNFRPEYHAGWMQKSWYQQLPLLPLGAEATAELLRDLLGSDPALVPLAALVRERTGGNPFFIEEVVQSLVDQGVLVRGGPAPVLTRAVTEIQIPSTVQAVLAARIDRLAEREKRVLQTAAVVGKRFTDSLLRRVLGADGGAPLPTAELAAALRALTQAEFLHEQALYPEVEYAFKHPLTREVAYGTQLAARRAPVHAALARALENLDAQRLGERAALLAHHWDAAGDAAQGARWHRRAAEWAGVKDTAEALRHWQRARALLDTLPRSRETLAEGAAVRGQLLVYAYRSGLSADEITTLLGEARELAEASGDVHTLGFVAVAAGRYRTYSGAPLEAVPLLEEAIAREDEGSDLGLRIWSREAQGWAYFVLGRLPEALASSDEGLALGQGDPQVGLELAGYRPWLGVLWVRGRILGTLGRLGEAARELDQAIAEADRYGDWTTVGALREASVQLCDFAGDVRAAVAHGRAAVEVAEKTGNQAIRVLAFGALGLASVLDGQYREAGDVLGQALAIARERRASLQIEAQLLARLARARLGLGDGESARRTAEEAIAVARRRGTRTFEIEGQLVLGRALIHAGARHGEVQAALDAAASLVEETGAKGYQPLVHLERAALARAVGDALARESELRAAHRLFTEMGAPIRAAEVERDLGA
jgi:adenylate cyclase